MTVRKIIPFVLTIFKYTESYELKKIIVYHHSDLYHFRKIQNCKHNQQRMILSLTQFFKTQIT
ncbi:hypothetical protein BpHYR1_016465 [Brachionus plicatilis]|uniref:Uncharacterized protein n=1 Tax=Brachionus plicatilis TaxID=10195 RepID=A0A3M7PN91_BRAPC|nr:hypothetical protein BpHYR1_016465 [Brachionus plicatilis]